MNVLVSRSADFKASYKPKTPYGVYSGEWVLMYIPDVLQLHITIQYTYVYILNTEKLWILTSYIHMNNRRSTKIMHTYIHT